MMDLLEKAKKAPKPAMEVRKRKWYKITPVIKVLREKEFTYKQITELLNKEGVTCKVSDVSQAYKRYSKDV